MPNYWIGASTIVSVTGNADARHVVGKGIENRDIVCGVSTSIVHLQRIPDEVTDVEGCSVDILSGLGEGEGCLWCPKCCCWAKSCICKSLEL
jgi:hypothetical protein